MNEEEKNNWLENRKFILNRLERTDQKVESLFDKIESGFDKLDNKLDLKFADFSKDLNKLHTKVTILETKAWMWGAIAGFIITAVVQVILIFVKFA